MMLIFEMKHDGFLGKFIKIAFEDNNLQNNFDL